MITLSRTHDHTGTLHDLAPDLTPMLDILFILLVFFMLTAGAVFQSLNVQLPSSVEETLSMLDEPKHIMLEISESGYSLDGKAIASLDELKQTLPLVLKQKSEHELVIAGDKDISMQRLLELLTYLQSQHIEAANILMKKEQP